MNLPLPPLDRDAVHVWLARADVSDAACAAAAEILDVEERERAARFRFDDDRRRAIVARATLRRLLGGYLSRDPRALRFRSGASGKPALTDDALEFNVSHSGVRVAIAVARATPIGIDVECERSMHDIDDIARRYFAPVEAAEVVGDPARFFAFWTAKEALVKAIGGGLSIGLASFATTPSIDRFTPVRNLDADALLDGWQTISLPVPEPGYHCALATRLEVGGVSVFSVD